MIKIDEEVFAEMSSVAKAMMLELGMIFLGWPSMPGCMSRVSQVG